MKMILLLIFSSLPLLIRAQHYTVKLKNNKEFYIDKITETFRKEITTIFLKKNISTAPVKTYSVKVGNNTTTFSTDGSFHELNFPKDIREQEIQILDEAGNPVDKFSLKSPIYEAYNFLFLNAANFDFTESLKSNYIGKINLFHGSIDDSRFGYCVGIMKISYNINDTSQSRPREQNVKLRPLDPGNKYLRQFNRPTIVKNNVTWSFYAQPNLRISDNTTPNKIYLHAHLELLVNKWNIRTQTETLDQDTVEVADPSKVIFTTPDNSNHDVDIMNGYFGAGITFDLYPIDRTSLFFQGTVGRTTNFPDLYAISTNYRQAKPWNSFYLIRCHFKQELSDQVAIVLGTDIRGIFPTFDPLYAAYIGATLSIDDLLKTKK